MNKYQGEPATPKEMAEIIFDMMEPYMSDTVELNSGPLPIPAEIVSLLSRTGVIVEQKRYQKGPEAKRKNLKSLALLWVDLLITSNPTRNIRLKGGEGAYFRQINVSASMSDYWSEVREAIRTA